MNTYTGTYGFVMTPTDPVKEKVAKLAAPYRDEVEFVTEIAHGTLYYANVKDAPEDVARKILERLAFLIGKEFSADEITVFLNKFLFWHIGRTEELLAAHKLARDYWSAHLDHNAIPPAVREGLNMPVEQRENVEAYGHPLCGDLFDPHFTLAYNAEGFSFVRATRVPHDVRIEDVVFAEIGQYGAVTKILMSAKSLL